MSIVHSRKTLSNFNCAIVLILASASLSFGQSIWETSTFPGNFMLQHVTYCNNLFVIGSINGGRGIPDTILISPDASNWTGAYPQTSGRSLMVTYGNGQYIGVGTSAFVRSTDAKIWTREDTTKISAISEVAYGNGMFVAIGGISSGFAQLFTSTDGKVWTEHTLVLRQILCSITYAESLFVAVGADGSVVVSRDGAVWTEKVSGTKEILYSVTYGKDQFVAVGENGTIVSSPDGTTWVSKTSGETTRLSGVTFGNGQFVAVGGNGTILSSSDATTWVKKNSGTTGYLVSVAYGNGRFVAVGGTILTSKADSPTKAIESSIEKKSSSQIKVKISNGFITATLPCVNSSSQLTIELLTIAGKKIHSITASGNNRMIQLPVDDISTGMYLMKITIENKVIAYANITLTR